MAERSVLMKNIKHPFLVGLHFSFQTTDKLYFVLDYVNGGEVSKQCINAFAYTEKGHTSAQNNWILNSFIFLFYSCSTTFSVRGCF